METHSDPTFLDTNLHSHTHTHIFFFFLNQQTGTVYFFNQLDQSITVDKALNSFGVYLVVCFGFSRQEILKKTLIFKELVIPENV